MNENADMEEQMPHIDGTPNRPNLSVGRLQDSVVTDLQERSVDYWLHQPAEDAIIAFQQIARQRREAANQVTETP